MQIHKPWTHYKYIYYMKLTFGSLIYRRTIHYLSLCQKSTSILVSIRMFYTDSFMGVCTSEVLYEIRKQYVTWSDHDMRAFITYEKMMENTNKLLHNNIFLDLPLANIYVSWKRMWPISRITRTRLTSTRSLWVYPS